MLGLYVYQWAVRRWKEIVQYLNFQFAYRHKTICFNRMRASFTVALNSPSSIYKFDCLSVITWLIRLLMLGSPVTGSGTDKVLSIKLLIAGKILPCNRIAVSVLFNRQSVKFTSPFLDCLGGSGHQPLVPSIIILFMALSVYLSYCVSLNQRYVV